MYDIYIYIYKYVFFYIHTNTYTYGTGAIVIKTMKDKERHEGPGRVGGKEILKLRFGHEELSVYLETPKSQ